MTPKEIFSTPESSSILPSTLGTPARQSVSTRTPSQTIKVRHPEEIPGKLLQYFLMDPKTRQPLNESDRYLFAQVYLHEIEEGARLIALAGQQKDASILADFSNSIYPSQRLDLIRRRLEDLQALTLPAQRLNKSLKARHNQCGAIKTRMGQHPTVAFTENGWGYKPRNEDAYLIMPHQKVLALCDGMGGHPGGDVASGMAVDFLEYGMAQGMNLGDAIALANQAILIRGQSDPRLGGRHPMGCTLAAIQLRHSLLKVAHMGDTRVLVVRNGKLIFTSQDHTKGQELLREGLVDGPTAFELNHILNRALGMDFIQARRDIAMGSIELKPGDRVGIFTDGITDNFFDPAFRLDELQKFMARGSLTEAADCIVEEVQSRISSERLPSGFEPKPDNISLALVEYQG